MRPGLPGYKFDQWSAFNYVGAPIMHGYLASNAGNQGMGGAQRVAASSAPLSNVGFPNNTSFFLWVFLIGVVLPGLVIGGLKAGRFQFVFRGR